jgi:hypothetical protein
MRVVIVILAIAGVLLAVAIYRLETSKEQPPVPAVIKEETQPKEKVAPPKQKGPDSGKTPVPEKTKTPPPPAVKPVETPLQPRWGHVVNLKR